MVGWGLKVPGGVVVWWWLRPILVFSLSLSQAEQYPNPIKAEEGFKETAEAYRGHLEANMTQLIPCLCFSFY